MIAVVRLHVRVRACGAVVTRGGIRLCCRHTPTISHGHVVDARLAVILVLARQVIGSSDGESIAAWIRNDNNARGSGAGHLSPRPSQRDSRLHREEAAHVL